MSTGKSSNEGHVGNARNPGKAFFGIKFPLVEKGTFYGDAFSTNRAVGKREISITKILMIFGLSSRMKYKLIHQRETKSCWRTDLSSPLIWEQPTFLLGNVLLFPK